jgi:hypothetical protein
MKFLLFGEGKKWVIKQAASSPSGSKLAQIPFYPQLLLSRNL